MFKTYITSTFNIKYPTMENKRTIKNMADARDPSKNYNYLIKRRPVTNMPQINKVYKSKFDNLNFSSK